MIILKRRLGLYYLNVIGMLALAASLVALAIFFLNNNISDKGRFILFFGLLLIAIIVIYFAIDIIIRTKPLRFNEQRIIIDKRIFNWTDFKKIYFNANGFRNGLPCVITELYFDEKNKAKIYNDYYKNYAALSQFILSKPPVFNHVLIEPEIREMEGPKTFSNKNYKRYRLFSSHFFVSFYILFFVFISVRLWSKASLFGNIFLIICMIFLLLCIYLPNQISITGDGKLKIHKLLLRYIVREYPLDQLYLIKYYYPSRGPGKMLVVTKKFQSERFYIDTISHKQLKELKKDLENVGIIVVDNITLAPLPMKANYRFRLSNKKKQS